MRTIQKNVAAVTLVLFFIMLRANTASALIKDFLITDGSITGDVNLSLTGNIIQFDDFLPYPVRFGGFSNLQSGGMDVTDFGDPELNEILSNYFSGAVDTNATTMVRMNEIWNAELGEYYNIVEWHEVYDEDDSTGFDWLIAIDGYAFFDKYTLAPGWDFGVKDLYLYAADISMHLLHFSTGSEYNINFFAEMAPVPEPATMLLLGSGLIGVAGIGRKKFKK